MSDDRALRRHRVRAMTQAGATALEIASALRVSTQTVARDRQHLGITLIARRVEVTPAMLAQIEVLLDDGCSVLEVARTVGCSRKQVALRFPGRGWSRDQIVQHSLVVRRAS